MESSEHTSIFKIVKRLCKTFFIFASSVTNLANMEYNLAKRSIMSIIVCAVFAGILLFSSWLCIIALGVIFLVSLQLSWLVALSIVFLFNIFMLIAILFSFSRLRKNLSFTATRKQIRALTKFNSD